MDEMVEDLGKDGKHSLCSSLDRIDRRMSICFHLQNGLGPSFGDNTREVSDENRVELFVLLGYGR